MSKQDYADWLSGLPDDERKRVEEIAADLRSTCEDPEALVLADARSEYALVARHQLGLDDNEKSSRKSARWSMDDLERCDGNEDVRRDKALMALRRMRAAGIGEEELLDLAVHIHAFATAGMAERIDSTSLDSQFLTDPGWAVMELRDGKMTGRLIAGGENYHPGQYPLDPWPDGLARPRSFPFWRSEEDHPPSET